MTREYTAEEFANMLPDNVGLEDDARSRLLCVFEILKTFTDADHGLTTSQIRDILESRSLTGKKPSEPSVLSDIKSIAENSYPTIDVERPARGKSGGFKCNRVLISSAQARLLINIVRTCKFITDSECEELCESLESLVSIYEQDKIVGDVFVDERARPQEPNVFKVADICAEALNLGRKVSFEYCYRGMDGKSHLVLKEDGESVYCETPIALIFSNGNYYLETWPETIDEYADRKHYDRRLDRMRNVRISEEPAEANDSIRKLETSVPKRTRQTFDMYADGKPHELFLEVDSLATNSVIARFGHDCKFENIIVGADGNQKGYLRTTVHLSPTFYRWLCGMGTMVRIAEPKGDLWEKAGSWGKLPTSMMTHSALLDDYRDAVAGYTEYLKDILTSYPS